MDRLRDSFNPELVKKRDAELAVPYSAVPAGMPLVIASGLAFMPAEMYGSESDLARAFYLTDRAACLSYSGSTIFDTLPNLVGFHHFRAHFADYRTFVREHKRFFAYGPYVHCDSWQIQKLVDDGAKVVEKGRYTGELTDNFLVEVEGALVMNETLKSLELLNRHLVGGVAHDALKISPASKPLAPEFVQQVKLRLLKMHYDAGVGHIGGNLSAIDTLLCLYHNVMGPEDSFVLSKGHSAGALYTTLWSAGLLTDADLRTFHKDGTRLSGHPAAGAIPQIPFATGSLGHGLGIAAGMALARKLQGHDGHVFCLTSDGEWNEGSCWEALIFARHQKLSNLTIIVDLNGLQGFGTTREVADLNSLADKFRAFGVAAQEVDGHNLRALCSVLPPESGEGPRAIVARTCKGFGVSFMEGRMEWHYLPMNASQYAEAAKDIEAYYSAPATIMGMAG